MIRPRDIHRRPPWAIALVASLAAVLLSLAGGAGAATRQLSQVSALDYAPSQVIVSYKPGTSEATAAAVRRATSTVAAGGLPGGTHLLQIARGRSVDQAIAALKGQPAVRDAVPDYRVHAADFSPDDPGFGHGWQRVQWNFTGPYGVDVPAAWNLARQAGAPGGRGVTVAVIDSGVAFENYHEFRRSPDFARSTFVSPYDFLTHDNHPVDRFDHGTHVAGTIAEETNNKVALTGIAYEAHVMPLRILDAAGSGDTATLARAIRYAVVHHAQVINLSLELDPTVRDRSLPSLVAALRYANQKGVVVVAAAGNGSPPRSSVDYPGAGPGVIAVGAISSDGCLTDYSNHGKGLALVAPGGGDDAALFDDPYDSSHCDPSKTGRDVVQETFNSNPRKFSLLGFDGTSFATPHVAAAVALLIATHRLGPHPTPAAILERLEATARPLGPRGRYGAGLLDIAAALRP